MQSAWKAKDELGVEVIVIKKTSKEYNMEKDPLPCPSIVLNGKVLANNGTITYEELKAEIQKQK
ncbi:MAG: hypothetical protein Q8N09_06815 [Thermodesulfovibrionia bacterium]|nr:hypothetical protein [Thermodesulfovibrionia bacterium]